MKVRVVLTLNIDTDAWTENYGVSGAKDIREDVRQYVQTLVNEQLDAWFDRDSLLQKGTTP